MSNAIKPRTAAQHDRMPSASLSRRAPTSRASVRDRPPSSGEVVPDDSASNISHRRSPSGSSRTNGSSKPFSEKQAGKFQVTSRDSVRIRTRSPAKSSFCDAPTFNGPKVRGGQEFQAGSRGIPGVRKEKQILRMEYGSGQVLGKLTWRFCSTMEASGISRTSDKSATGTSDLTAPTIYASPRISGVRASKAYVH